MSIKADRWIRQMAEQHGMIEPFEPGQVRERDGERIVSYGTSSYGYDVRCADEFKVFTNIESAFVDPKSFDESSYARQVAEHFGTAHHEQLLQPSDLVGLLPEVTAVLDEPMADASIIPTYALSKFTREHVTVALGGDGGDELLAGYPTFQADRAARAYRFIPRPLRNAIIRPLAKTGLTVFQKLKAWVLVIGI